MSSTADRIFEIQFNAIREADSFFFQRTLTVAEQALLPSFGDIIQLNVPGFQFAYHGINQLFPQTHSIFFHTLFCKNVINQQCIPRHVRQSNK